HDACGGPSHWPCGPDSVCLNRDGDDCNGPGCLGLCIEVPPCSSDADCRESEICVTSPDPECRDFREGSCYPLPLSCAPSVPVCGCDGVTYASACSARSNRVAVAFDGTCDGGPTAPPSTPGETDDPTCSSDAECDQ